MSTPTKVGQYTLERKLGEGGMAEVWEGRHDHLGTSVAIKFLLPYLAGDPELEERFLNEGKRQARLHHPNIVPAIDFIQQDGRSFLVMQYIEGQSLETRLHNLGGPVSREEVHEISWDVLSALDYAHSMGLVHRDVKPSNILLDPAGRVWLTDFGIALAIGEESRLTRAGSAVGTAVYMSPEQIVRPREVDARTDIYSFGCVLYAMLSGGPPFGTAGETEFHIKDCHVRTPPPPLTNCQPPVSPAVEQVVLKCLEKDPAKRFATCGAVMSALDAALSGATVVAPPSPPPPSPPMPPPPVAPPPAAPIAGASAARNPRSGRTLIMDSSASGLAAGIAATPAPSVAAGPRGSSTVESGPSAPPPVPPSAKPRGKGGAMIAAIVVIALLAAGAAAYFFLAPPPVELRLEGSTTVGDALAPALLKAYLTSLGATSIEEVAPSGDNNERHDIRAKLSGHWRPSLFSVVANGSPNAFKALGADRADIGMASRPVNDAEARSLVSLGDMRSPACENIVALDGIAVIVNRNNPLPPLNRQQLAAIFRGTTVNWSEVGGHPGPIHLFGRTSDSGTFDTFVSLVMGGDKKAFSPNLKAEANGDDIAKEVAADPGAIGYVGLAQIGNASALELSGGPGATPLLPSAFTVSTEDYILSRRLFMYTPSNPTDFARKFVAFAVGPEGQKVVESVGFVEQTPHFEQVVVPAQAPAAYRARTAGLRRISLNFRFRPNSTQLDNKALADVNRAVAALTQNSISSGVQILGFADSRGTPAQNLLLSQQRAGTVAEKLRANGISGEVTGFSSEMPVADNSTEDGRNRNRRVEVWVR